ncbi:MAG: DUF3800 domain-containing protein [Thermodesulfobacteriota bacterium]
MKFYIDESGSFSIPEGFIQHSACVVTCVVVSEFKFDEIKAMFESYSSTLTDEQFVNGEPKGSKLTKEQRIEFCEMLLKLKKNILVVPITVDMTLLAMLDNERTIVQKLYDRCMELRQYMLHETMKEQLELLAKQFKNLSYQECLKIICYAHSLYVSMRYSILCLSSGNNEKSWNNIEIEIDKSNKKLNSREKIIFSKMLSMWFEAWSKKEPFTLLDEIHTPIHPFVKNYCFKGAIDGNKLINNNLKWTDSKDSFGIKISDFASNIIFNAVNDLENKNNTFTTFCELMKLSPYGFNDGPGLFTPFDLTNDVRTLFRRKYKALGKEMIRNNFKPTYYGEIVNRLEGEIEA